MQSGSVVERVTELEREIASSTTNWPRSFVAARGKIGAQEANACRFNDTPKSSQQLERLRVDVQTLFEAKSFGRGASSRYIARVT